MLNSRIEISLLINSDWLKSAFSGLPDRTPFTSGDGYARPETSRPAAVLVPVMDRPDGLTILFTRRTEFLKNHAGQISFPGGRAEASDRFPSGTALREAEEEIGLRSQWVEILGSLPDYATISGYRVTPVVGLVQASADLHPDSSEVAEMFEVPLEYLLDPINHQRNTMIHGGSERHYYAFPFGRHYIWGATAGMLMNLYQQLAGESAQSGMGA